MSNIELSKKAQIRPLSSYSAEEVEKYSKITRALDPNKPGSILSYGSEISSVAEQAADELLKATRRSNAGDAGKLLGDLCAKLGQVKLEDPGRQSGWKRKLVKALPFLKPLLDDYERFISRYDTVAEDFDKIKNEVGIIQKEIMEGQAETGILYNSITKYQEDTMELIEGLKFKMAEIDESLVNMEDDDPEKQRLTVFRNTIQDDLFQKLELEYILESSKSQIVVMTADDAMICQKAQRVVQTTIPLMKQKAQICIKALKLRYYHDVFDGIDKTADELMKTAASSIHSVTNDIAKMTTQDDFKFETVLEEIEMNKKTVDELVNTLAEGHQKKEQQIQALQDATKEMKKSFAKAVETGQKLFGNSGETVKPKELKW